LITADTVFGELRARSGDNAPPVLLLRRHDRRRAKAVAELILANLEAIDSDLTSGALVVFNGDRIRIRALPIDPALIGTVLRLARQLGGSPIRSSCH
jgi:hypothetical protein